MARNYAVSSGADAGDPNDSCSPLFVPSSNSFRRGGLIAVELDLVTLSGPTTRLEDLSLF